jgi:hypothetical protein
MEISFVFINSFLEIWVLTKGNVKIWQCCLKRRSRKCDIFHVLFLASERGGTVNVSVFRSFHKLWKKTITRSFVMSVFPHGISLLLPDGFSWNFILERFSKMCKEIQFSLKSDKNEYFQQRPVYIFDISLRSSSNEKFSEQCRNNKKYIFYVQ